MSATTDNWTFSSGWLDAARRVESPNYNERPAGIRPKLIVVHGISLPPGCYGGGEIESFFCNALNAEDHPYFAEISGLQVSAHFLIYRTGELVQFVDTESRAWHAGVSEWRGRENCNDFSIGIELEGCDDEPYADFQYSVLNQLIQALQNQYPLIQRDAIVGHCEIAPGRKTDPGPAFDWSRVTGSSSIRDGNAE
ncbi:MAG: 1,6-anhydro-N-acetylmuramyl-L-alanine amidase AmpD [Halieaceae bacterium]